MLNESSKGDTIYILGSSLKAHEKLEAYFLDWQKRRVKKGTKLKILYNHDAKKFGKIRSKIKLTEVRYLPKNIITPVSIDIAGNLVGTMVFTDNPLCFSIKNNEVADNYRTYFELLWKQAKK